jgi:hypothetical protein
LAFYRKQGRWQDALQLMGQHRHHLVSQNPPLCSFVLGVLTEATEEGVGDPAWIRLLAEHMRGELDTEVSASLQVLLQRLDKLVGADGVEIEAANSTANSIQQ